jgi:hypothetical protein
MVANDPSMLEGFSKAEKEQMVEDIWQSEKRRPEGRAPTISRRQRT